MPLDPSTPTAAIIGTGLAGLSAAGELLQRRFAVRLFDKGRSPGGRASTRGTEHGPFDHGAQYFTVRDPRFARLVEAWRSAGVVEPWTGEIVAIGDSSEGRNPGGTERFVGVGGMAAIARHLSVGLRIEQSYPVARFERQDLFWYVRARDGRLEGPFDVVLVTAPAPQAAVLLAGVPALARRAASVRMRPTWSVLVAYPEPLGVPFAGAFVNDGGPLAWVSHANSRPGGDGAERFVLHATNEWTEKNLDRSRESISDSLTHAFAASLGRSLPYPTSAVAHLWRYAIPDPPLSERCLYDAEHRIGASGDWCGGPRVEGAVLGGLALADAAAKSHAATAGGDLR